MRSPRTALLGALLACVLLAGFSASASASTTNELRGEWSYVVTCSCEFPGFGTNTLPGTEIISKMELTSGEFSGSGTLDNFIPSALTGTVTNNEISLVLVLTTPGGTISLAAMGAVEASGNEIKASGEWSSGGVVTATGTFTAKKTRSWLEIVEQEAREKGEQEGKLKGEKEGKETGEKTGKVEGEKTGKETGEKTGKVEGEKTGKETGEGIGKAEGEKTGKEKAEQEAKLKAEQEATGRQANEAQAKSAREAKEKAEKEATEKADTQAREKAEQEAREKVAKEAGERKSAEEKKRKKKKKKKPKHKPHTKATSLSRSR